MGLASPLNYVLVGIWVLVSVMVIVGIALNLLDRWRKPRLTGGPTVSAVVTSGWSPEFLLDPDEAQTYLEDQLVKGHVDLAAVLLARFPKEVPKGVYEGKYVKTYYRHWVAQQVARKQGIVDDAQSWLKRVLRRN